MQYATSEAMNYQENDLAACRVAALMQKRGISKGDRVLIILPNSLEFVKIFYGSYDGFIYGKNQNGDDLPGFPINLENSIISSPVISDLDRSRLHIKNHTISSMPTGKFGNTKL